MAMRIEFIAPVEYMRGNLSGKQNLEYPENNNPAWDTPDDGIKYARNYTTRYIGAKRTATGKAYFSVKRRTGVNNTTISRQTQAALGVARIYAQAVMVDAGAQNTLAEIYRDHVDAGYKYSTMAGFLTAMIRNGLLQGDRVISIGEQGVSSARLSVTNVFNTISSAAGDVTPVVQRAIIAKFFPYIGIGEDNFMFGYIGSIPFAFAPGNTWEDLTQEGVDFITSFNQPLVIQTCVEGDVTYITCNLGTPGLYIIKGSVYVKANDVVTASKYNVTSRRPA